MKFFLAQVVGGLTACIFYAIGTFEIGSDVLELLPLCLPKMGTV